jgi:hypothetical protein
MTRMDDGDRQAGKNKDEYDRDNVKGKRTAEEDENAERKERRRHVVRR